MLWFRKHLRQGSWLALVALAINFMLAFGHVHASGGTGSERQIALIAAGAVTDSGHSHNNPADHADYLCPICMAAAAMGTAVAPGPPALAVEFAGAVIDRIVAHIRSVPQPTHTAFLSRGPPIA